MPIQQFLSERKDESPPKELEQILQQLPPDKCRYERGIVAFPRGKPDEATDCLHEATIEEWSSLEGPIGCDALWHRWIQPFGDSTPPNLSSRLADSLGESRSGSTAHLLLQGYAALDRDDTKAAEKLFAECLDVDASYWLAALSFRDGPFLGSGAVLANFFRRNVRLLDLGVPQIGGDRRGSGVIRGENLAADARLTQGSMRGQSGIHRIGSVATMLDDLPCQFARSGAWRRRSTGFRRHSGETCRR